MSDTPTPETEAAHNEACAHTSIAPAMLCMYVHGVKLERERDAAREALRQILGWRELRSGANEIPIERIEDIARAALARIDGP